MLLFPDGSATPAPASQLLLRPEAGCPDSHLAKVRVIWSQQWHTFLYRLCLHTSEDRELTTLCQPLYMGWLCLLESPFRCHKIHLQGREFPTLGPALSSGATRIEALWFPFRCRGAQGAEVGRDRRRVGWVAGTEPGMVLAGLRCLLIPKCPLKVPTSRQTPGPQNDASLGFANNKLPCNVQLPSLN